MAHKIFRILAPIGVLLASLGAYAVLQATKPVPSQSQEQARPSSVQVAIAAEGDVALDVRAQGEVRARTTIDLVSQIAGRIVAVSPEFVEGGNIKPDVALLRIEDTDYTLALQQAEAQVADAELAVEQALADADVARKQLRNERNPSDLALRKPQIAQARANLEAAKANLTQATINLERTQLTLPFSGRVASISVNVGQYITPGTSLARVFSTDVVEVRLPLSNTQLASLGLPIGYTAPSDGGLEVDFSAEVAGEVHHWYGRLARLDAAIDPETRMLFAMAELADPYGENMSKQGMPMAVGLFVDATIKGREVTSAVNIPRGGLRAGNMVYVVNGDGQLEIREVKVLHTSGELAVIASGLKPGEQVVTSAIRNPIPGMPLQAISSSEG
ncbi:MAG: efflux RND transporter periplasmic adaptor subunit [Pseudomonadota bacterium]